MPLPHAEWTLEMVHALPDDGNRYELIDGGLLVSPSPSIEHQRVLRRLFVLVQRYVEGIGALEAFFAPLAVSFTNRRELQPDLLVCRSSAALAGGSIAADRNLLLLAVEVLSPSTSRADRYLKRPVYQEEGVPEYWIVDHEAKVIERWRPEDVAPEVCLTHLRWEPEPSRAPLMIDVLALFSTTTTGN